MNIFRMTAKFSAAVALLLFICGCMEFEYSGREFAPLAPGESPAYFESRDKIPAGKYTVIGRAQIVAKERTDKEDIKLMFLDEAALRGADAVCVVKVSKIKIGLFESDGEFAGPSSGSDRPFNLTPDGAPVQDSLDGTTTDRYLTGEPAVLTSEHNTATRMLVKALFLKDKAVLEKIISEREKQLDAIIGKPASQPGESR